MSHDYKSVKPRHQYYCIRSCCLSSSPILIAFLLHIELEDPTVDIISQIQTSLYKDSQRHVQRCYDLLVLRL